MNELLLLSFFGQIGPAAALLRDLPANTDRRVFDFIKRGLQMLSASQVLNSFPHYLGECLCIKRYTPLLKCHSVWLKTAL